MPDEPVDPRRAAAATVLDARVAAELAAPGGGAQDDPLVADLVASLHVEVPAAAHRAVAAALAAERHRAARTWRAAQVAAAAMAALIAAHGLGNLLNSEWVAAGLGEAHGRHAYVEGGLALLAVSVAVAAGLFRRRLLPLAAAVGTPLGLALGVQGVSEIGHFGAGAALHLTQATVALVLGAAVLRTRRYGAGPPDE